MVLHKYFHKYVKYSYLDDLVPISFVHFLSSQLLLPNLQREDLKRNKTVCVSLHNHVTSLQPAISSFNIPDEACVPVGIIPIGVFIYETSILVYIIMTRCQW